MILSLCRRRRTGPGHWVGFDDLSPAAQDAIRFWTDVHDPAAIVEAARTLEWQEELVPLADVLAQAMASGDHAVDFNGDWEAYHAWYLSGGDVPDHGTSRWPVIENSERGRAINGEYLDDGWHRLHSYVRAGDTHIPVLRHRDPAGG